MGRPRKAPDDRAETQVGVRLTGDSRRRLDWLAVRLRARSASEVVRQAVDELYDRTDGTDDCPKRE
jgi:predicted transcriptional regulator